MTTGTVSPIKVVMAGRTLAMTENRAFDSRNSQIDNKFTLRLLIRWNEVDMRKLLEQLVGLGRCERGMNTTEYALLIGIIAMSLIIAMNVMGSSVESTFESVDSDVQNTL